MDANLKTHPIVMIAAIAVIVTCLLAIGVMTGIVPSPLTKQTVQTRELSAAPATASQSESSLNRYAPSGPAAVPPARLSERPPAPSRAASAGTSTARAPVTTTGTLPATGGTESPAPTQTVSAAAPAPAPCKNCGTVSGVRTIQKQGEASMIGPAAGALIGGVVGNQIGSGRGNTIATVVGAGGGAAVGTEIERRSKSTTHYDVAVRMNDGTVRHFTYASAPGVHSGDKVRVVDGRLVRN